MARYKSILVGVRVVHAGRVRKCYHSKKHTIVKGDIVLEVRQDMAWFGYCEACGAEILRFAAAEVAAYEQALQSHMDRTD
jgi:hypothetical protein